MTPFSWKNEMKKADLKFSKNILIYEKTGQGDNAANSKKRQLELRNRIKEMFPTG